MCFFHGPTGSSYLRAVKERECSTMANADVSMTHGTLSTFVPCRCTSEVWPSRALLADRLSWQLSSVRLVLYDLLVGVRKGQLFCWKPCSTTCPAHVASTQSGNNEYIYVAVFCQTKITPLLVLFLGCSTFGSSRPCPPCCWQLLVVTIPEERYDDETPDQATYQVECTGCECQLEQKTDHVPSDNCVALCIS